MIETNIFERWLDAEAERVGQKLADNKHLEPDDKLTIVLKGLTNHVAHLDVDLREQIIQVRTDLQEQIVRVQADLQEQIVRVRTDLQEQIVQVQRLTYRSRLFE